MASYNKYHQFVEDLIEGVHDFDAHTFKIALSNTAPNASTHAVRADITELTTGAGYTQDGHTTNISSTNDSSGTVAPAASDVVITAASGSIGPFRYAIFYNTTPSSPADPLISWWDYGSSITLNDTESFTVDFGASVFSLA